MGYHNLSTTIPYNSAFKCSLSRLESFHSNIQSIVYPWMILIATASNLLRLCKVLLSEFIYIHSRAAQSVSIDLTISAHKVLAVWGGDGYGYVCAQISGIHIAPTWSAVPTTTGPN